MYTNNITRIATRPGSSNVDEQINVEDLQNEGHTNQDPENAVKNVDSEVT